MIRKHILLTEEEVPYAQRFDEDFLRDLQVAEEYRLREEAREQAQGEMFDGSKPLFDYRPKVIKVFKGTPDDLVETRRRERKERLAKYWEELAAKPQSNQAAWELGENTAKQKRGYMKNQDGGGGEIFENDADAVIQGAHLRLTLESLATDGYKPGSTEWYAAWLWVRIPYHHAFSFRRCCLAMGADPEVVRERLEDHRRQTQAPKAWRETEINLLRLEVAECSAQAQTLAEWEHVGELRDQLDELTQNQ